MLPPESRRDNLTPALPQRNPILVEIHLFMSRKNIYGIGKQTIAQTGYVSYVHSLG